MGIILNGIAKGIGTKLGEKEFERERQEDHGRFEYVFKFAPQNAIEDIGKSISDEALSFL